MCRIEGCDAKPVAKGLCPRHYMRQRRTGCPTTIKPMGAPRKNDRLGAMLRSLFPEWSKSKQDRYIRAFKTLEACGGVEAVEAATREATRPQGSLNVAHFERHAALALLKASQASDV